jgi:hypothetical protein
LPNQDRKTDLLNRNARTDRRIEKHWIQPTCIQLPIQEHTLARLDGRGDRQCYELSNELRRKGVTRTPEQRLEIALNVAAILTRVAERITGSPYDGAWTPEKSCVRSGTNVGKAFLEWLEGEAKGARHRALDRAAELVLGKDSEDWMRERAGNRDTQFLKHLHELDAIVAARVANGVHKFDFERPRLVKRKWYEIMPDDPDCHVRSDATIDEEKRRALQTR